MSSLLVCWGMDHVGEASKNLHLLLASMLAIHDHNKVVLSCAWP